MHIIGKECYRVFNSVGQAKLIEFIFFAFKATRYVSYKNYLHNWTKERKRITKIMLLVKLIYQPKSTQIKKD